MSEGTVAPITPDRSDAGVAVSTDDLRKLEAAFPIVEMRGGDEVALALQADVPVHVVMAALADPATAAQLLSAQDKAGDNGSLLKPMAARLALAILNKLDEAVAAGALDVDDFASLLPKVHKVVEHADRMDVARGDGYSNLTVFHIHFGAGGSITGKALPAVLEMADEVTEDLTLDTARPSAAMSNNAAINADVISCDDEDAGVGR